MALSPYDPIVVDPQTGQSSRLYLALLIFRVAVSSFVSQSTPLDTMGEMVTTLPMDDDVPLTLSDEYLRLYKI